MRYVEMKIQTIDGKEITVRVAWRLIYSGCRVLTHSACEWVEKALLFDPGDLLATP